MIGQILPNGCAFGTSRGACGDGAGGDFNLFGFGDAPFGSWQFELTLPSGDAMLLTSLKRADVPEPGSLGLLALALAGVATVSRTKRSKR